MTLPPGSGSGDIPPPWHPFIPPFDPPGSSSPPTPPDPPEGSSTDDDTSTADERPDWWPEAAGEVELSDHPTCSFWDSIKNCNGNGFLSKLLP